MSSLDLRLKDSFAVPVVPTGDACHRFPARLDSSRRLSSQSNAITAHRRAGPQRQPPSHSKYPAHSPLPWRGAESSTSSDSDAENPHVVPPSSRPQDPQTFRTKSQNSSAHARQHVLERFLDEQRRVRHRIAELSARHEVPRGNVGGGDASIFSTDSSSVSSGEPSVGARRMCHNRMVESAHSISSACNGVQGVFKNSASRFRKRASVGSTRAGHNDDPPLSGFIADSDSGSKITRQVVRRITKIERDSLPKNSSVYRGSPIASVGNSIRLPSIAPPLRDEAPSPASKTCRSPRNVDESRLRRQRTGDDRRLSKQEPTFRLAELPIRSTPGPARLLRAKQPPDTRRADARADETIAQDAQPRPEEPAETRREETRREEARLSEGKRADLRREELRDSPRGAPGRARVPWKQSDPSTTRRRSRDSSVTNLQSNFESNTESELLTLKNVASLGAPCSTIMEEKSSGVSQALRRDLIQSRIPPQSILNPHDIEFGLHPSSKLTHISIPGATPADLQRSGYNLWKVNSGTFCSVFRARWRDREVAVKCPDESLLKSDGDMMRFRALQEWRILARTHHPHVLNFHGGVVIRDQIWLVTDFIKGGDLYTLLYHRPPEYLRPRIRLSLMEQLCDALTYLHTLNPKIAHKDIKCNNLLVGEDLRLRVCDFGDAEEMRGFFLQCCTAATWQYTPPELIGTKDPSRPKGATEQVDVWAMGCVFLEILRCATPFVHILDSVPEDKQRALLRQCWLENRLESECRIPKHLPERIRSLISKCLSFDARRRPTATQVLLLIRENREELLAEMVMWQTQWENRSRTNVETMSMESKGMQQRLADRDLVQLRSAKDIRQTSSAWAGALNRHKGDASLIPVATAAPGIQRPRFSRQAPSNDARLRAVPDERQTRVSTSRALFTPVSSRPVQGQQYLFQRATPSMQAPVLNPISQAPAAYTQTSRTPPCVMSLSRAALSSKRELLHQILSVDPAAVAFPPSVRTTRHRVGSPPLLTYAPPDYMPRRAPHVYP